MSERRAAMANALNKAIEIFCSHSEKTFDDVMTNGIQPVADAMGLDRVCIYRHKDTDEGKRLGMVYLWDRSAGGTSPLDERLTVLPDNKVVKGWIAVLSNGGRINSHISKVSGDEAALLSMFAIRSIFMTPVFSHGDFWGIVTLEDHSSDEYFSDDSEEAAILQSAAHLFANAVIRENMTQSAAKSMEALEHRKNITDTLNKTAALFLSQRERPFADVMTEGIKPIVDLVNIDRLSVWRNSLKPDGLHSSQIYRWEKASGGTTSPLDILADVTYAQYAPNWEKIFAENNVVNSPSRLMHEHEAAVMKRFGAVSAFVTPVFINNAFWGFVFFEDHHTERYFDDESAEILRSAAFLFTNAVIRGEMEREIAAQIEINHAKDAQAFREITEAMNDYRASLEYDLMKYRLTGDALGIALWDMEVISGDPVNEYNTFTWSQEFRAMLGFDDDNDFPNLLSSWSNRLHPDDKERTLNAFRSHITDITGKTPYDLEYRLLLKNGEYRHFRAFGTTMRDSNGTPLRVAGALQDIHDKKTQDVILARTREENDLQLAQLNAVVTAAKIGLWDMWIVKDDPINPVNAFRWSDEFRFLLGYSNKDDFPDLFSSWSERIHPDDFDMVMNSFEKHVLDSTGQTPYDVEYRIFKKNGECIYIRDFGNIIRDENGNALRAAGAIEDITERQLMQETLKDALEESNKVRDFTTNILNKSDAMIYVTDLETDELLFITDYMKRHFGIEGDVTGQPCYKVLQKGMDERCAFCPCRQLDKEPDKVVVWEERNTLTNCYYLNTDRYVDWPGGKKVHIQYVVDLTEIKDAQEKLEQREKKLEALNKMAAILLSQEDESFGETMSKGLKPITEAAGVDRVAIYKLLEKNTDQLGQVYLWYGETIPLEDALIILPQNPPVVRWTEKLRGGISINENVSELPEDAAEFLSLFGVKAIYFVPIFIKGEFWGIVTLEDHTNYRYFDEDNLDLMQSAAHLCANAFMRTEMEHEIAIAEERTKLMLDSSPFGCNIWDQDLNIIDCNEAAINLYGVKSKQEYLEKFLGFSPEFQPDGKRSYDEVKLLINRAFYEGSITFEWMHRKPDGTPLPAEITLVRVKYGNGHAVVGYTRDLRAEKQAIEHIRLMMDKTPFICNLWSKNYEIFDCNSKAIELFGMDKKEYMDRFLELAPQFQPDGQRTDEKAYKYLKKAFEEGECVFEWMNQKLDGTPIPMEVTLVRVAYGVDYIVVGYARDLRAEKQALEHMKLMLNATPLCCQLWDRNNRMIDCNEEAVKLFGMKDKQEFLEDFYKFSPEYQLNGRRTDEMVTELLEEAFTKGKGTFSWVYQMQDGTLMPAEGVLTRIKYKDDYAVAVYTRDMREHNKMMEAIEYRNNILRTLNDTANLLNNADMESFDDNLHQSMKMLSEVVKVDRVYIWENYTVDGQLYFKQTYEWSGNAEPQQGKEFTNGIPYSDNVTIWGKILPTGKCINGIVRNMSLEEQALLLPQGIVSILVVPIIIKDNFWGFVGFDDCRNERIFTDEEESVLRSGGLLFANALIRNELILNIRETSVQLESALKQANAASKAKGDFLSNMSHEMRTPMNAIIGMTTIGKNAKDMQQKDHALNKIGDASSHLLGVINDVLDMAKIEADKLELSSDEFNFEKVLQKVITVISFRVDEKRQHLSVKIDGNIPRFVVGDDQRLAQVITNLLSNAVKFTPEEGSIHLGAYFAGETSDQRSGGICELRIEVTDSGIGISPEQQHKIFQAFEQAESGTSRNYGGTGLGLVISKRIIELMGGTIWVESELGKGAKFIFTIKAGRGKKSPCSLLAPEVNWENIRILVVDDMIETCNQFQDIFGQLSIQCDAAFDGQEALKVIEEHGEYDIYFIDWRMPVMDGIELTRRIKSRGSSRPSVVTMITAADWEQIKQEAFEAGVDKCLLKPLFSSMIIDCVNECLGTDDVQKEDAAVKENEFEGKRLLVAEDIEINREILIALLENTGLIIDCAENGKKALDMIRADPDRYDLVFMDMQMPEMDGLEATRCIRAFENSLENAKQIPIVAMTANVFKEDIENCLAAGMNDHLGKPLDMNEVFEKLRKYLFAKQ